jgi:hypothetical protein
MFAERTIKVPLLFCFVTNGFRLCAAILFLLAFRCTAEEEGSGCLWLTKERLVFTGDTLFAGTVGRTDLHSSSSIMKDLPNPPKAKAEMKD